MNTLKIMVAQTPLSEKKSNKKHPNAKQQAILQDLAALRASAPIQFEVATNRIGQNIKQTLQELQAEGWVESIKVERGLEDTVFYPSDKALKLLSQQHPANCNPKQSQN